MNKQTVKRMLDFVLMRQVANTRNLTSLALVAFFFGVYLAAGGKIASVPNLPRGSGFGDVTISNDTKVDESESTNDETDTKETDSPETTAVAAQHKDVDLFDGVKDHDTTARANLSDEEESEELPKKPAVTPDKENSIENLRKRLENLKKGKH